MYPLHPILMTVNDEAGSGEDDLVPILLKQCSHSLISNHTLISLLAVLSVFFSLSLCSTVSFIPLASGAPYHHT